MVQEAEDGVRRQVFRGISGTIPDCYAAREDIATGRYAAICDRTTMRKAMSWDFRWVANTRVSFIVSSVFFMKWVFVYYLSFYFSIVGCVLHYLSVFLI
ncbi:hypothetical protein E2C01_094365 [Portunus trituberculatus]|uniref:Uncharacterized protein n=1 Tax=Portunus trituberculatus TaxID=210409 RepID=A0A5B7JWY9_PORTR|nr:hypothetical protein [Portunus trituberculatus]